MSRIDKEKIVKRATLYTVAMLVAILLVLNAGLLMKKASTNSWQPAEFSFAALSLLGAITAFRLAEKLRSKSGIDEFFNPKPRPIVRIWYHNKMMGVVANADYQLYWQRRERMRVAYPDHKAVDGPFYHGEFWWWPFVELTAIFTDDPQLQKELGEYWTGPEYQGEDLVHGCQVEKSELSLPWPVKELSKRGWRPVTLQAAYRLIHGPDAKPPAG